MLISLVYTVEKVCENKKENRTELKGINMNTRRSSMTKTTVKNSSPDSSTNGKQSKITERDTIDDMDEKTKIDAKMLSFCYINRLFLFFIDLQISYNKKYTNEKMVLNYYNKNFERIFKYCGLSPEYIPKFTKKNISYIERLYNNKKNQSDDAEFTIQNFKKSDADFGSEDPIDIAIATADALFDRFRNEPDDHDGFDTFLNKKPEYAYIKESLSKLIDIIDTENFLYQYEYKYDPQISHQKIYKIDITYKILEFYLKKQTPVNFDVYRLKEDDKIFENPIDETILIDFMRYLKKNTIRSYLIELQSNRSNNIFTNLSNIIVEILNSIWNFLVFNFSRSSRSNMT